MSKKTNTGSTTVKNVVKDFADIISARKIESVLCLLGVLLSCAVFRYIDGLSFTAWSLEIFDSLFRGGFSGFGELMSQNLWSAPHGTLFDHEITCAIWGIWNLPLLLIHYIFKTDHVITAPMYMWSKMFLVVILIATGYVCYKIVTHLSADKKRGTLACLLIWGSATAVLISIGFSAQDEILYMFLLLLGLYDVLVGKVDRSLIWMSLCCIINPVMLLFVALIYISACERCVGMILRIAAVCGVLALRMIALPMAFDNSRYVDWYFGRAVISAGNSGISLFIVVIAFVYLAQFFVKRKDVDERNRFLCYSLSIVSLAMCTFCWLHFYRFFTCVPFMAISLMITKNEKAVSGGLVGFCIFEYCKTIVACSDSACLNLKSTFGYVQNVTGCNEAYDQSFFEILCSFFPILRSAVPIIGGIALICGIWVLCVAYPRQKCEFNSRIPIRAGTLVWTAAPLLFTLAFLLVLARVDIVESNIEHDDILASPFSDSHCIEQYYRGDSASAVSVTVRTVTWGRRYPYAQRVCMEIVDADTDEVVGYTECSPNDFKDNNFYTLNVRGVTIKEDEWYIFRFSCKNSGDAEENGIYFLRSDAGTADPDRHYAVSEIDGTATMCDYDIVSKIVTF